MFALLHFRGAESVFDVPSPRRYVKPLRARTRRSVKGLRLSQPGRDSNPTEWTKTICATITPPASEGRINCGETPTRQALKLTKNAKPRIDDLTLPG